MKRFNNLLGAVYCTVVCLAGYALSILFLAWGVAYKNDTRALVILLIMFAFSLANSLCLTYYVLFCSYQQWIIKDNDIILKKLVGKNVCINENEIQKIEKKPIFTIRIGPTWANAFIVHGKKDKITILINEKYRCFLEEYFSKYESIIEDKTVHPGCLG